MGLGLSPNSGGKPWTTLQTHSRGRGIPTKLGDLNALSRFPEKRSKRLSLFTTGTRIDCVQKTASGWVSKQRQIADVSAESCHFPDVLSDCGCVSAIVTSRRSLDFSKANNQSGLSRKSVKYVTTLKQEEAQGLLLEAGTQHFQEGCNVRRPRTVTCAAKESGEPNSSSQKGRLFIYSIAAAASASVFAQRLWSSCQIDDSSSLESDGGVGDSGAGNGDHGGGRGGGDYGGDGNGNLDAKSSQILIQDLEDDEQPKVANAYRGCKYRVLASLSSAAGDALDGEAPFGDRPLGRDKRAGIGKGIGSFRGFFGGKGFLKASDEKEESQPGGLSGGVLQNLDKAAQDRSSFLAPMGVSSEETSHHQERPVMQEKLSGGGPSMSEREAMVDEVVTHAMQLLHEKDGDGAPAKRFETAALRRLQREAFSDLLKVRERLDKIEFHTGLRHSKTASSLAEASKTRLKGEVCTGGAFVLLDDSSSRHSRSAIEQAGLYTGLDVQFTFETMYREKDVMITECSAGHAGSDGSILGGPISVTKLIYNAQITDDLTVVIAPLGARGSDITETVNPLQGQALTQFARVGPALYNHCVGSALGATLRGSSVLLSVSQYLSDWGSGSSLSGCPANTGPLCLSTLAQIMLQPWENSVFSVSAVNRYWPSPPLPSFTGLHWSEMGPLILSKRSRKCRPGACSPTLGSPREMQDARRSLDNPSAFSANASWGTPYGEADQAIVNGPENHGTAMQSVAVAGEIDVGANVSFGGWAQVERGDWLQEPEKRDLQWGVTLAKTLGKSAGWGLCIGSQKLDMWSAHTSEETGFLGAGDDSGDACGTQLHLEAFMKLSMGRGFTLQPGLIYLLNNQSQTPAFILRSSWAL